MFGFGKKRKIRRQRARQFRAEAAVSPWAALARRVGVWPALVGATFFVLIMFVASWGEQALPYALNQKIGQPIVARVDFTVSDPKQAAANVKAAREAVPNYYRVNTELVDRIAGELTAMFEAAQAESFEAFQLRAEAASWPASKEVYEYLHDADDARRESFTRSLERLRDGLLKERTARPTALEGRDPPSKAVEVIVYRPAERGTVETQEESPPVGERIPTLSLIQIASRDAVEGRAIKLAQNFDFHLAPAVKEVLLTALTAEPLLTYEQKRTQDAMAAAERDAPPGEIHYERGKPFVFPHRGDESTAGVAEETGLTKTDLDLLEQEARAYAAFLGSDAPQAVKLRHQRLYERIGVGLVLFILTASLFAYVGLYQPRIFEVRARTIAFAGLLLVCLIAVRLGDLRFAHMQFALTPVLLAAAILTIAYPQRFAAGVTVVFVAIVSLVIRADVGTMITLMAGGYVTALLLHDIRTRTRIITAGALTGLLVCVTSFAFGLIDHQELTFALRSALLAAGNAMLAALIIQGALPFIERVFRVATALTLLEYRDANRPVLQRLAREAPGTYNHSLVLGTMSEAACESIEANGLLAHVGALYHDIGKIPKAEYFSENQEASINRHDSLAPSMSLLIILGHVKDGLELAKEYALPRVLYPFIAEHHGTTVVKYFHHVASEKQPQIASGKHDREVAEAEFRYPGPKPQTKETAVLMLCDGVEGAVRALHEPTAGRIESIVNQVLQARLKDGQFDECDITLRELHRVEESLVKSLCRFYHGRVVYPKDTPAKTQQRPDEVPPERERKQLAG